MKVMIAIRLGVAGALVFGAAVPASAQQVGTAPSEKVELSVCVIPLGAAGVPGAGVDVPNAAFGTGTNNCTFRQGGETNLLLNCDEDLVGYTGGQFSGPVDCDILDCATDQLVRVTGEVSVSNSGQAKLRCEFKG